MYEVVSRQLTTCRQTTAHFFVMAMSEARRALLRRIEMELEEADEIVGGPPRRLRQGADEVWVPSFADRPDGGGGADG
jgi:hypothetical protein